MAARINKKHTDSVRERIKVQQLLNMLQSVALTGVDLAGQEVSPARLKAAEMLLQKALPSLSHVESHTSGDATTWLVQAPIPMESVDDWQTKADAAPKGTTLPNPKSKLN